MAGLKLAARCVVALFNADDPSTAGSAGAPGTPAVGDEALADLVDNRRSKLYFQAHLDAAVVDSLFNQVQACARMFKPSPA